MVSAKKELEKILETVKNSSSPQELKDNYFKTKEIIFEGFNSDDWEGPGGRQFEEIPLAVEIFLELDGKLKKFYVAFLEGHKPTDEEINLALLACDESSQGFILLGSLFPNIWTEEKITKSEELTDKIRKGLIEEKVRRQNPPTDNGDNDDHNKENEEEIRFESENSQKRADELQKKVDNLRSKNKPIEANKLQKKVEEIKKNTPTKSNPTKSNPTKSNPTKSNPTKSNNDSFPSKSFFIGGGVGLVVGIAFLLLIISGNRKKNKTR